MSLDRDTTYYTFTTDPLVTDDGTLGYIVNDFWTNTTTDEQFVCLDVTTGSAIWKSTTLSSTFFASSITTATTTSLIDVLLTGMALTPGTGNYLAIFNATCSSGTNQSQNVFSIYVNGVRNNNTNTAITLSPVNSRHNINIVFKITGVGVGQVVDVRWKVNVASTGSAYERTLTLIKT
jgi:hypothetical protein